MLTPDLREKSYVIMTKGVKVFAVNVSTQDGEKEAAFPTLNPKHSHLPAVLNQHVSTSPLPILNNMEVVNDLDRGCLITGTLPAYLPPQLLNLSLFSLILTISTP